MMIISKIIEPLNRAMRDDVRSTGLFDMDVISTFTVMAGKDYPSEPKQGFLFYGRATNGWDETDHKPIEKILKEQTFRPFFNLMYYLSWEFYGENWYNSIAWSNLCKLAPMKGGNPNDDLWFAQYPHMVSIIKKEVELLSPAVVVLITGNTAAARWDDPFFEAFPTLKNNEVRKVVWGNYRGKECTASLFVDGNLRVLVTDRPEARPINSHSQALLQLLQESVLSI